MSGDDEWFTLATTSTDEWIWYDPTMDTTETTITATQETPEIAPTESGDVFAYTVMAMIVAGCGAGRAPKRLRARQERLLTPYPTGIYTRRIRHQAPTSERREC